MKTDILKFIKRVKRIFLALSVCLLAAAAVLLIPSVGGYTVYYLPFAFCVGAFVLLSVLYTLKIKHAVVYDLGVSGDSVCVTVKGGKYVYSKQDAARVLFDDGKFLVWFRSGGTKSKFVFLRRVPFDRFGREQFSLDEIAAFFPQITGGRE